MIRPRGDKAIEIDQSSIGRTPRYNHETLQGELSHRQNGRTLHILDEPTTVLHFDDVKKLLAVLQRLVDLGNTVVVIEHQLDVLKSAGWVIDLGPEGGERGGYVVATGTSEQVARRRKSYTGQALAKVLP